jgi:hypothetical protein
MLCHFNLMQYELLVDWHSERIRPSKTAPAFPWPMRNAFCSLYAQFQRIPPRQAALLNDMFPIKHVALRLTLRSVDAGRGSGRG